MKWAVLLESLGRLHLLGSIENPLKVLGAEKRRTYTLHLCLKDEFVSEDFIIKELVII